MTSPTGKGEPGVSSADSSLSADEVLGKREPDADAIKMFVGQVSRPRHTYSHLRCHVTLLSH